MNAPSKSFEFQLRRLDRLAKQWRQTGECPDAAGVLSSGEYKALVFAAGFERELHAPVRDFLFLDEHLQRWILETWEYPSLVGMRIGR